MPKVKTAISFGLVNIPVAMYPAIRHHEIGFNMLHKKCGERIKYQKYCPNCEQEVKIMDIVKGYEYENEAYVTFDDSELAKLKTPQDNMIEIFAFVKLAEIDPLYYEKSYYLEAVGNDKAFILLSEVLNKEKKVAIAKTVLGYRETIVALRFSYETLIMSTLHFYDELKLENKKFERGKINSKELEMASRLVAGMSDKFTPEKYKDEYLEKLEKAIDLKLSGKKIVAKKTKSVPSINNLMEALEKSLKETK